MIRDTSREAYNSLDRLNEKQKAVLQIIRKHQPCTDQQIAAILQWPINRVTPRRGELEKKGVIVDAGKTKTSSGRQAHVWRIKSMAGKQIRLEL
jgi:predicted ArsR family transcriptional regulator